MRLLNFASRYPEPGRLETPRTILQRPQIADFQAWAELRRESADFLRPFEPAWTHDELTRSAFRSRLRRQEADVASGRGLPWFLFDREDPEILLGGLTISNIRRGVAETGTLGYWMGIHHAGKGHMQKAMPALLRFAFDSLRLERVEAATLPHNERSKHLLIKSGFTEEGYARKYLEINGKREDHLLFSILKSDFNSGA